MADPTAVAREAPGGIALHDGYTCKITLADDPDISFWEKSVTPFGYDGGDPIDTTNMHRSTYRTQRPPQLISVTAASGVAAYDPNVFSQIISCINVLDNITVTFYDGSTQAVWGWLRRFEPQEVREGAEPLANFTIEAANWDLANNAEAGPAITSVAGT